MSYQDAVEATVTKAQALAEIRRHQSDVQEFLSECGDKRTYSAKLVLDWLGY